MKIRPQTSILSPLFSYDSSVNTDIRRRFARVQMAQQKTVSQQAADTQAVCNVFNDRRKKEIEAKETALRG